MKFRARNFDYHRDAVEREREGKTEKMDKSILFVRSGLYEKHLSRKAKPPTKTTQPMKEQRTTPTQLTIEKIEKNTDVTLREEPKGLQHGMNTNGFAALFLLRITTETRTKRISNKTWFVHERERQRVAMNACFIYRLFDESVVYRSLGVEIQSRTQATRVNRKPSSHHQLSPDILISDVPYNQDVTTSSLARSANVVIDDDGQVGLTNAIVPYVPIPNYAEPTTAIVPYIPLPRRQLIGRDQKLTNELEIWAQVARIAIQTMRPNANKSVSTQGNGQDHGRKRNSQVTFSEEPRDPTSGTEPSEAATLTGTEDKQTQDVIPTDNEDIHHPRPAKKQKLENATKKDKSARKKAKKEKRKKRRSEPSQTSLSQTTKKPRPQSFHSIPGAKSSTDVENRLDLPGVKSCSPPFKRKSLFSPGRKTVQGPRRFDVLFPKGRAKEGESALKISETHTEYVEVETKPNTGEKPAASFLGNSSPRQSRSNWPSKNNSRIDTLSTYSTGSSGQQMKKPTPVNPTENGNVLKMKHSCDVDREMDVSEGNGDPVDLSGNLQDVVPKDQSRSQKGPVLLQSSNTKSEIGKRSAQEQKNRRHLGRSVLEADSVKPVRDLLAKQDYKVHGLWGRAKTLSETKGNHHKTDRSCDAMDEEASSTAQLAANATEKAAGLKRHASRSDHGMFARIFTNNSSATPLVKTTAGKAGGEKPTETVHGQGKGEGRSIDQRNIMSQGRALSNGLVSTGLNSQKQTRPEDSDYCRRGESKKDGNRQLTIVRPSNGSHFKVLIKEETTLGIDQPKRKPQAQMPRSDNAPATTKGMSTHVRPFCHQPSGETTEQLIESNRESRESESMNRKEIQTKKDGAFFCTEQFIENWGDVVSNLGCGRWAESHTTNENFGRKIMLIDTPLMNLTGVDIELPGRCGVQLFSATALNSTAHAKAAVLHVARLAAIGRFSRLYLYISLDCPLSRELSKHLFQLQCAAVAAGGLPETKVSVQTMLREHLTGAMAQTIFRHVDSSPHGGTYDSMMQLVTNRTTVSRAFLLQSLVPLFSLNGALECLCMAQDMAPEGCPSFQMLLGNQQILQRIMVKASSVEAKSSVHPNAIRQLSQVVRVSTKTGTIPA